MNLFELFVKIGVDDQASNKLKDLSGKLGSGLATAAKIGTAAVGAAAAGITALTTAAVNNYSEYEQLVGGVDTLFKDSSQKLKDYAANAYSTAGMSANDYMSNATSFAAALISSLEGDTDAAVEAANRAMVSMSDNANKMGTDMESIVQTYQSLSRGNFAMLDNLKLGYGGTKAELERLIADAASYTEIQKEMGVTVDASSTSFDNIVNAIAVVQGHLGIAGATAAESATTIEGSVNSMKAAWSNLVTGIADENANFQQLIDNFVDSAIVAAENIIPRVGVALQGAGQLIDEVVPVIIEKIPAFIDKYLPKILESGVSIVLEIAAGIIKSVPQLVATVPKLVSAVLSAFNSNASTFLGIGEQIINGVWDGISRKVEWFTNKVKDFFSGIVTGVKDTLGIHSPSRVFAGIGGNMALGLGEGWDDEYERIQRDIVKGINFGEAHVGFADSKLGMTSANMINSVASAETAPIQLTAKFYWSDGREMASLMLGDLIQVAQANGTPIGSPA